MFGAAGERSGDHVGRLVHVDPGSVEGDLVVEGFQHLGPVVDSLRVCEVWPYCVYQIPNLNDNIQQHLDSSCIYYLIANAVTLLSKYELIGNHFL